jgi:hypothetical protein
MIVVRLVLAAALTASAVAVHAADPLYLGRWKLEAADVAPWAGRKPDPAEKNRLLGKVITIDSKAIAGPQPFACRKVAYKIGDATADLLFQGAFGEMHDRDKSVDPLKLAASVGFSGTSWKTLETGCEIDWHFVDAMTAKIGLNDFVYTLKKQ